MLRNTTIVGRANKKANSFVGRLKLSLNKGLNKICLKTVGQTVGQGFFLLTSLYIKGFSHLKIQTVGRFFKLLANSASKKKKKSVTQFLFCSMKTIHWVSTKEASKSLDISTKTLYRMIKSKALKRGVHYRLINPRSHRPTYQFNCDLIKFCWGELK